MTITQRLLDHVADYLKEEEESAIWRLDGLLQDNRLKTDIRHRLLKDCKIKVEQLARHMRDPDKLNNTKHQRAGKQNTNELWH